MTRLGKLDGNQTFKLEDPKAEGDGGTAAKMYGSEVREESCSFVVESAIEGDENP